MKCLRRYERLSCSVLGRFMFEYQIIVFTCSMPCPSLRAAQLRCPIQGCVQHPADLPRRSCVRELVITYNQDLRVSEVWIEPQSASIFKAHLFRACSNHIGYLRRFPRQTRFPVTCLEDTPNKRAVRSHARKKSGGQRHSLADWRSHSVYNNVM